VTMTCLMPGTQLIDEEVLKSVRPESSMYSTSSRIAFARRAPSRKGRSSRFAATFPAEMMRAVGVRERPMFTACGRQVRANEPPSRTCEILRAPPQLSAEDRPAVAIDAFANWSSRTSRCERKMSSVR